MELFVEPGRASQRPNGPRYDAADKGGPPTRAVALRYRPGTDRAPRVIAAGERRMAEAMITVAREHGVPVREDPGLAALLFQVDVGEEIPPSLYLAVAEVLVFVYRMDRAYGEGGRQQTAAGPTGR